MDIDWSGMFVPRESLVELVLRGSFMYLSLFVALRVLVRRHVGSMSLTDLLLLVLIADAAQNAMAGKYESITEGVVLCATLVVWNVLFDVAAYVSPTLARLIEAPPLPVIKDGKMLRRNMRQELITVDELESLMRVHGVEDISGVRIAYVEPDGMVSVFMKDGRRLDAPPEAQKKSAI